MVVYAWNDNLFNTVEYDQLEDGEQNLEDEAEDMMLSWTREELLREVQDEKLRLDIENRYKSTEYYDGFTTFSDLLQEMTPVGDQGVWIKILLKNSVGKQIDASMTIFFDIVGYLEFSKNPTESSIYDGKPKKLNLAEGPIIPGLLQALLFLREGESANILIAPEMAYGALGALPLFPPHSYLYYNVKIIKVWDSTMLEEITEYEETYKLRMPVEEKLALIEEHKNNANAYLKDGHAREALIRYKAAIKLIDESIEDGSVKLASVSHLLIVLLVNAAIVYNQRQMHRSASKMAKRALLMDPKNPKAYYQLIKAKLSLSEYASATRFIELANKNCPDTKCFDKLKLELDFQCKDEKKKRDEILTKMAQAYASTSL